MASECGTEAKKYYVSAKSRTLALLLACIGFLGLAGLHRIYVGKCKTGALYLMTVGFFLFGTLYDLYELYAESFKDADGFPLYADTAENSKYGRRPIKTSPMNQLASLVIGMFCFWGLLGMFSFVTHPSETETQIVENEADKPEIRNLTREEMWELKKCLREGQPKNVEIVDYGARTELGYQIGSNLCVGIFLRDTLPNDAVTEQVELYWSPIYYGTAEKHMLWIAFNYATIIVDGETYTRDFKQYEKHKKLGDRALSVLEFYNLPMSDEDRKMFEKVAKSQQTKVILSEGADLSTANRCESEIDAANKNAIGFFLNKYDELRAKEHEWKIRRK